LIGEQVSDLTDVQPEQVATAPVQLPQSPYFDGIVQTDEGIMQLIAVERIREATICDQIPNSGAEANTLASSAGPQMLEREASETNV
jgi:hypothetical protein